MIVSVIIEFTRANILNSWEPDYTDILLNVVFKYNNSFYYVWDYVISNKVLKNKQYNHKKISNNDIKLFLKSLDKIDKIYKVELEDEKKKLSNNEFTSILSSDCINYVFYSMEIDNNIIEHILKTCEIKHNAL